MSGITEMILFQFMKENVNVLSTKALIAKFLEKFPDYENVDEKKLSLKMTSVYNKIKKLKQDSAKKANKEKLKVAEVTIFSPATTNQPEPSTSQAEMSLEQVNADLLVQVDNLVRDLNTARAQLQRLTIKADAAQAESVAHKKLYEDASAKLVQAELRLEDFDSGNAKRREVRHKATIADLRKELKESARQNELYEGQIETLANEVSQMQSQIRTESGKLHVLKEEKLALSKNIYCLKTKLRRRDAALKKQTDAAEEAVHTQWSSIRSLQQSNTELQELLDHCEKNEIQTFKDGEYVIPIREIVLHLTKLNVAQRHISQAIKVVIEKLTPLKIGRLPSYGTINNIVHEAKCLALLQAGKDMLSDEGEPANILMEDATSKKRTKYNAIIISTSSGYKNVGLPAIASEDAETLVSITKETFAEISKLMSRLEDGDEKEISKQLYKSIKGTMSDSCGVMKKFHRLMSTEIGTHAENASLVKNHYCFLHVIINLGEDACAHGLVDIDKCCYPPEVFAELHSKTSSTTYSAILLAARMFHQMGSEKYGRADVFEAFLGMTTEESPSTQVSSPCLGKSRRGTQILAKTSYFEREVGNRAHITFHNGNALWFHRKQIIEFLELQQAGNMSTETMKTLHNLLKMKVPLASARALGIIKCCITGPFQNAFDVICSNIYEMVPYTIKCRDSIQLFSVDASSLLEDPQSIYTDIPMESSELTASLFYDTNDAEMDSLTILALQLILKNLLIKFERYCNKYLSEGEFAVPTADERNDLRNCPLTNRACESVMAALDRYVRSKPNATPGFLESLMMLRSLDLEKVAGLSEVEKEKQWKLAKKYSSENIAANKAKLRTILDSRRLMLEQQKSKVAMKVAKQRVLVARIMAEMSQYGGGWRTGEIVDLELEKLQSTSMKKKALIAHIQSMKHIYMLKDSLPSSKKKLLRTANQSVEQLTENLKGLITHAPLTTDLPDFDADEVTRITGSTLLSQEQRTLLFKERISILQERLLSQRQKMVRSTHPEAADEEDVNEPTPSTSAGVKRTTALKTAAETKKVFMPDPLYLVGKRVEHTFLIRTPGKERRTKTVFTGSVISITKPSIDPLYTQYKIRYDHDSISGTGAEDQEEEEEEEEVETDFIYDLLIDYINGDLKVIE